MINKIKDNSALRFLLGIFFTWGDDVRPVVQKPIVKKIIGNDKFNIALDNGCGRGLYTNYLIKKSDKVFAIDISLDNLRTQKRRNKKNKNIFFVLASAENLPFKNNSFDLVLCTEVLEHLDKDEQAVQEISRVAKDNSKIVVSVPVPPAPIDDKEHKREGYTFSNIENLLNRYNLIVINHKYCMFVISRIAIKFISLWNKVLKIPVPSVVKLPLYIERIFSNKQMGLPYDLVIKATKEHK